MSLAQKVQGMVDNFLQRKDEVAVVSECLYPPPPRFDPRASISSKKMMHGAASVLARAELDLDQLYDAPPGPLQCEVPLFDGRAVEAPSRGERASSCRLGTCRSLLGCRSGPVGVPTSYSAALDSTSVKLPPSAAGRSNVP